MSRTLCPLGVLSLHTRPNVRILQSPPDPSGKLDQRLLTKDRRNDQPRSRTHRTRADMKQRPKALRSVLRAHIRFLFNFAVTDWSPFRLYSTRDHYVLRPLISYDSFGFRIFFKNTKIMRRTRQFNAVKRPGLHRKIYDHRTR